MRIYNRKKRAISLVMAIMVMSNSIQITGLAEGEKEEGKKIIISEFQELPEELSSMKVPEGTSQEEFEKLFPDTLMVKTYRDDAEEQKPEQPTSVHLFPQFYRHRAEHFFRVQLHAAGPGVHFPVSGAQRDPVRAVHSYPEHAGGPAGADLRQSPPLCPGCLPADLFPGDRILVLGV